MMNGSLPKRRDSMRTFGFIALHTATACGINVSVLSRGQRWSVPSTPASEQWILLFQLENRPSRWQLPCVQCSRYRYSSECLFVPNLRCAAFEQFRRVQSPARHDGKYQLHREEIKSATKFNGSRIHPPRCRSGTGPSRIARSELSQRCH